MYKRQEFIPASTPSYDNRRTGSNLTAFTAVSQAEFDFISFGGLYSIRDHDSGTLSPSISSFHRRGNGPAGADFKTLMDGETFFNQNSDAYNSTTNNLANYPVVLDTRVKPVYGLRRLTAEYARDGSRNGDSGDRIRVLDFYFCLLYTSPSPRD